MDAFSDTMVPRPGSRFCVLTETGFTEGVLGPTLTSCRRFERVVLLGKGTGNPIQNVSRDNPYRMNSPSYYVPAKVQGRKGAEQEANGVTCCDEGGGGAREALRDTCHCQFSVKIV